MRIDAIFLRELRLPLVKPFQTSFGTTTDRRILLVELRGEGLTGWGECVAGEHPFFSDETVDTAWLVMQQEVPGDFPAGARAPDGEGCAGECGVGSRGADARDSAGEFAGRNAGND
jgi:O-succinylbenzoate synthase